MLKKIMIKHERIGDFYFKDKLIGCNNYFLSRTGKPLTAEKVERVISTAGKIAGIREEIRCSPHTLRHYFAQTQRRNRNKLYAVSRLLGHESLTITKRYLQSMQDKDILESSVKTSPLMNLR